VRSAHAQLIYSARDSFLVAPDVLQHMTSLLKLERSEQITPDEALGSKIEVTFDVMRGLCESADPAVSREAKRCLQELTAVVARTISLAQFGAHRPIEIRRRTKDDPPRDKNIAMGDIPENYAWLVQCCYRIEGWSVVTLNFDSVLDWVFRIAHRNGLECRQYSFWLNCLRKLLSGSSEPDRISHGGYVKLHGTFDLNSCHNPNCEHYRWPFADDEWDPSEVSILLDASRVCKRCGGIALPLILPPGRNKTQGEGAYHEMAHSAAIQLLGKSDTWVILGYSCPDYDRDVTAIFREAIECRPVSGQKRSIIVISPNCIDVAQRLADQLAPLTETAARYTIESVHPIQLTFSEMVESVQSLQR
jgi:hypothetical protein